MKWEITEVNHTGDIIEIIAHTEISVADLQSLGFDGESFVAL